jgi:phosphatidate cytidylyltransferase
MAIHWPTFITRAITAIVFVIVMAAGLFWSRWSFFLLFSVIHFGCWIEYQRIISKINSTESQINPFHNYALMIAGWCLLLFFTNGQLQLKGIDLSKVGLWLGILSVVILPIALSFSKLKLSLNFIGYSLFGLVYISLSLGLMIYLRSHWSEAEYSLSMVIPAVIIFSLWINDTMAYIVGSLVGKTPLSPISPKKTWEGTIGGLALSILIMCTLAHITGRLSLVHTAMLTFIAAVSGTFGDMFQSKLKRMAGVKDSGKFMPGHGGFLDRFDSLLFAAIACTVYAFLVL